MPPVAVGPPETPPGRGGGRRRWWLVLLAVVVVLVVALAGSRVEIPLVAITPGSAVAVTPLISVAGEHVDASEGEIHLLTVRLSPLTMAGAVQGWLDRHVDVVRRSHVAPADLLPSELRQLNVDQMETSKQQALGVAFEVLGHDAITGTGAAVVQVVPGSPAAPVLASGDTITGFAGRPVTAHDDVLEALRGLRPGSGTQVVVESPSGEQRSVSLVLAADPDEPDLALLGATLRTRGPHFDFPFEVDIASERIGGPSAGLAFTLQVLDMLTAGDLTGGRRVAATGTIELNGSVGVVGAVAQKTAVAVEEGIELLLVPRAEADEARQLAGDRLTVAPVDTLSEALRVLTDYGGDPLAPLP